jgi:hypothetical protein
MDGPQAKLSSNKMSSRGLNKLKVRKITLTISWTLIINFLFHLKKISNGKESTINRALGGSTYPG